MTKDRNEYFKAYYQAHKEEKLKRSKTYYQAHKEEIIAHKKEYNKEHKEQFKAHQNEYMKSYLKSDVNAHGESKNNIRSKSRYILKKMHLNIPGYQTHHCFGYEDASKFIYCSKSLHLKIHQFLRDNNIDASSEHWMAIRDIVNSTDEFVYIKC